VGYRRPLASAAANSKEQNRRERHALFDRTMNQCTIGHAARNGGIAPICNVRRAPSPLQTMRGTHSASFHAVVIESCMSALKLAKTLFVASICF
jgi:hypothetical protein